MYTKVIKKKKKKKKKKKHTRKLILTIKTGLFNDLAYQNSEEYNISLNIQIEKFTVTQWLNQSKSFHTLNHR